MEKFTTNETNGTNTRKFGIEDVANKIKDDSDSQDSMTERAESPAISIITIDDQEDPEGCIDTIILKDEAPVREGVNKVPFVRMSGAQKRKIARLAAIEAGLPLLPRKPRSNRKPGSIRNVIRNAEDTERSRIPRNTSIDTHTSSKYINKDTYRWSDCTTRSDRYTDRRSGYSSRSEEDSNRWTGHTKSSNGNRNRYTEYVSTSNKDTYTSVECVKRSDRDTDRWMEYPNRPSDGPDRVTGNYSRIAGESSKMTFDASKMVTYPKIVAGTYTVVSGTDRLSTVPNRTTVVPNRMPVSLNQTGGYWQTTGSGENRLPVTKRYRSEGFTSPSDEETPHKVTKLQPRYGEQSAINPSTYRGGGSYMPKMAIILKNYPDDKLTEEQAKKVQQAILAEVFKCAPGTGPQFKNSYADNGIAYITCANDRAQSWLTENIPYLQPWEGAALKVVLAKDILRGTKVIVWIPTDLINERMPKKLLAMLETQNVGLKTQDWRLVSSKTENKGITLVLEIGNEDLKALSNIGFKPFLGFTQLNFKVIGRKSLPAYAEGIANKPSAF